MFNVKKFFSLSARTALSLFLCAGLFSACAKEEASPAAGALDSDTSYSLGMFMANQFSMGFADAKPDYQAFLEGFTAYNQGEETRITPEAAMEKVNALFTQLQKQQEEEQWALGAENREEGDAYLATNRERSGVTVTPSGLQYEVITEGSGQKPAAEDTVRVHYEGTLINGTVFDSSYDRGEPAEFQLNQVIPGWTEGVQLMSEGSTYRFVIPSDLAYGDGGSGSIPPSAVLIFKVELLEVVE